MIQALNHVYTGDCRDLIADGVDLMYLFDDDWDGK